MNQISQNKNTDILDISSHISLMKDDLKYFQQSIADEPTISNSKHIDPALIQKWFDTTSATGNKLNNQAKLLQSKFLDIGQQDDTDNKLANISKIQDIIQNITNERVLENSYIKNLQSAQNINDNLKIEYLSYYTQYTMFFFIMIIVACMLSYILVSQESRNIDYMILIIAILFIIYHFSRWVVAII